MSVHQSYQTIQSTGSTSSLSLGRPQSYNNNNNNNIPSDDAAMLNASSVSLKRPQSRSTPKSARNGATTSASTSTSARASTSSSTRETSLDNDNLRYGGDDERNHASRHRPLNAAVNHHHGQASGISSVINLLNTIVGAGILAMPYAIKADGVFLGISTILLSAITAGFGLYLQARCALYVDRGAASFFALSQITYPSLSVVFDLAIAVKCFGVGVSYLIIIGDLMPQVMTGLFGSGFEESIFDSRTFWIMASFAVVAPLSFLRTLHSLRHTSMVALVSVGYLILLVVYHYYMGGDHEASPKGPVRLFEPEGGWSMLSALPIMVFAYTCHQNMFSIVNEIQEHSTPSMGGVICSAIGLAAIFYLIVGLCGYLTFGDNVGGNVISMYTPSIGVTLGRFAMVILVMLSYPLQCHPCRNSLNLVLHSISGHHRRNKSGSNKGMISPPHQRLASPTPSEGGGAGQMSPNIDNNNNNSCSSTASLEGSTCSRAPSVHIQLSDSKFYILTIGILCVSLLTALSVQSLERVLAYVGATGSTSISFILPGFFGYRLLPSPTKQFAAILAIYGGLVMVLCLTANLLR